MSRKAQALPLNTIILAILVVLVLVVVAAFFLGGTGSIMKSIREIFYGTTAGTSRSLAIDTCNLRCEQIKDKPASLIKNSAYCQDSFKIDLNNDGEADYVNPNDQTRGFKQYHCNLKPGTVDEKKFSLDVPCLLADGIPANTLC